MKTLKRFWTADSGNVRFCTTDNSTEPFIANDSDTIVKATKQNLFNAICSVNADFAECNSHKNYTRKELLEIAENHKLLFSN